MTDTVHHDRCVACRRSDCRSSIREVVLVITASVSALDRLVASFAADTYVRIGVEANGAEAGDEVEDVLFLVTGESVAGQTEPEVDPGVAVLVNEALTSHMRLAPG